MLPPLSLNKVSRVARAGPSAAHAPLVKKISLHIPHTYSEVTILQYFANVPGRHQRGTIIYLIDGARRRPC